MSQISKSNLKCESGIYYIKNIISSTFYIGQSINVYKRLISHKSDLKLGKHTNPHLQRSFLKNGQDVFEVGVMEYCQKSKLCEKEIFYINSVDKCYNHRDVETCKRGHKRPPVKEKTRILLSKAHKGKIPKNLSDIQQLKSRKVRYITPFTDLTFNSIREAAEYFNTKSNNIFQYIGKNRESKYFPKIYSLNYE